MVWRWRDQAWRDPDSRSFSVRSMKGMKRQEARSWALRPGRRRRHPEGFIGWRGGCLDRGVHPWCPWYGWCRSGEENAFFMPQEKMLWDLRPRLMTGLLSYPLWPPGSSSAILSFGSPGSTFMASRQVFSPGSWASVFGTVLPAVSAHKKRMSK